MWQLTCPKKLGIFFGFIIIAIYTWLVLVAEIDKLFVVSLYKQSLDIPRFYDDDSNKRMIVYQRQTFR
jgi:hypothetical protein